MRLLVIIYYGNIICCACMRALYFALDHYPSAERLSAFINTQNNLRALVLKDDSMFDAAALLENIVRFIPFLQH